MRPPCTSSYISKVVATRHTVLLLGMRLGLHLQALGRMLGTRPQIFQYKGTAKQGVCVPRSQWQQLHYSIHTELQKANINCYRSEKIGRAHGTRSKARKPASQSCKWLVQSRWLLAISNQKLVARHVSRILGVVLAGPLCTTNLCDNIVRLSYLWTLIMSTVTIVITLYLPMTHICIKVSQKRITFYVEDLILGVIL